MSGLKITFSGSFASTDMTHGCLVEAERVTFVNQIFYNLRLDTHERKIELIRAR